MLLLDTHVWIWALEGTRLGRRTRQLIARHEADGTIRVSTVSLFEVAALHSHGRLRLAQPLEAWIRSATELIHTAPLTHAAAIDGGQILRTALADPLDRLLVATARDIGAVFVSADERILTYAPRGGVRVHDARR